MQGEDGRTAFFIIEVLNTSRCQFIWSM